MRATHGFRHPPDGGDPRISTPGIRDPYRKKHTRNTAAATRAIPCPDCSAPEGAHCTSKAGQELTVAHWARQLAAERRRPQTLTGWLAATKGRGATITIQQDGTPTTDPFAPEDEEALTRYRHALQIAAAGTYNRWWNSVLGRNNEPQTTIDDIPTTNYTASEDGLAFACACCGNPAFTLDPDLLAWCDTHA